MSLPQTLCRDCAASLREARPRCPKCGSRRLISHPELHELSIGHIDCDAFYATVEKRDRPELATKPLIVGGEHRGVVAACCYIARMSGVRSAMPIHEALDRCPGAVVLPPDMAKYKEVGRRARAIMEAFAGIVEPISIDEAFLDLGGVEERLGISAAQALAEVVKRLERDLGITASIGLSYCKLLAKVASDLDKPRGYSVIGKADAEGFLSPRPVSILWGVGPSLAAKLAREGIDTVGELRQYDEIWLVKRYGAMGRRLYRFARGQDDRKVEPEGQSKSISAEETLDRDTADPDILKREMVPLAQKVARKMAAEGLVGRSVVLKLKTSDFQLLTRSRRVDPPTRSVEDILVIAQSLLDQEAGGQQFRLIGVGCSDLAEPDQEPDLFS